MKLFRVLCFSLLLTHPVAAISLFPELTNVAVAVTTNREAARGMAFDGTNFLVVYQGDNLFGGTNATNQLAAQLVSPDGPLVGPRVDLQLNGGLPLVAFGTSNYLMVWANPSAVIPGIYGQLLDRSASRQGAEFLIASNAGVSEVNGIVFAHEQFCVVWSATNTSNTELIQAQRLSPAGDLLGPVLAVGAASSAQQRFPHIDQGSTNFFLTWVAQRSDTNAWDVLGRYIDIAGNLSPEFPVSETAAGAAYRVASAFDGTNHLVAWSREAGPSRRVLVSKNPRITNDVFYPMLFGRLVGQTNAPEFPISRARWGQTSPSVGFDGTNFAIAWNDHRQSVYGWVDDNTVELIYTNYLVLFHFITPSGSPAETEFAVHSWRPTGAGVVGAFTGPRLCFGPGMGAVLRNLGFDTSRKPNDVRLTLLLPPDTRPGRLITTGVSNGIWHLRVEGPDVEYTLIRTTNLADWPSGTNVMIGGPFQNAFQDTPRYYRKFEIPLVGPHAYIRALNGLEVCKHNLRRITRAKEHWALDNRKTPWDSPSGSDLRPYAPELPWVCPNEGYYSYYSYALVYQLNACTCLGHEQVPYPGFD